MNIKRIENFVLRKLHAEPERFGRNSFSSLTQLVHYLFARSSLKNIIYIGNLDKAIIKERPNSGGVTYIGNPGVANEKISNINVIDYNIEVGLPKVEKSFLENSIVVLEGTIENIKNSEYLLKELSFWQKSAPIILISVPDKEKWEGEEFLVYLQKLGFEKGLFGFTPKEEGQQKTELLYIGGRYANPKINSNREFKICAIVSTYNEEDIIGQVIEYLIGNGIYIHIIDNWSTDSTIDIVREIANNSTRVTYERFPNRKPNSYQWAKILDRKIEYANSTNYDWYIHYDADEIRESCWDGFNLLDSIRFIDGLGFNAIDHTVLDFRPTKDGFGEDSNPTKFFDGFEFFGHPGNFAQIKAWKKHEKSNLSKDGGHVVYFDSQRVFPFKFLLRHYSLRSKAQMKKKVLDRILRGKAERKKYGWHSHYEKYIDVVKETTLWSRKSLIKYDKSFYAKYFLERLTGLNIPRE